MCTLRVELCKDGEEPSKPYAAFEWKKKQFIPPDIGKPFGLFANGRGHNGTVVAHGDDKCSATFRVICPQGSNLANAYRSDPKWVSAPLNEFAVAA
jgi:hypothetical protein